MNTLTGRLLSCFFCLFLCLGGIGHAQGCRLDYTPNYATYGSVSLSADGQTVYSTALTDGSTSGSPSAGCNYPYATHTAKTYNTIGSVGGWANGTPGYMTSYLSVQNNQQAPIHNIAGCDLWTGGCDFTYNGTVICSVFGTFFNSGSWWNLKIRDTYFGPPPQLVNGHCIYTMLACSTGTPTCKTFLQGPVFVGPGTIGCPQYVHAETLVSGGVCTGITLAAAATKPGPCN
jgi:hypothetical protein